MESTAIGYWGIATVVVLLIIRVPIAVVLGCVSAAGIFLIYAWRPGMPLETEFALPSTFSLLATTPFEFINSYALSTVPLFIFIGHLAFQAGFTGDIYQAARLWLARVPGGLAIASVVGCGDFSAISGSSVACAATMGRIAVPEMLQYGYAKRLAAGSVAIGGTLGSLIPPSILFILFGVFAEQSIARLFVAAVIPGLLSLVGYIVVIAIWTRIAPHHAPSPDQTAAARERMLALSRCWSVLVLFVVMIGGIYLGFFTPTEAAGVGAGATLFLGLASRRLDAAKILEAIQESVVQTAMLFAIAISGKLFVVFIALSDIPSDVLALITQGEPSVFLVMGLIVALYLFLGMVLDPLGIILLTLPLTVPIVEAYGLSLIWFGVIVVKLLEVGLVTPPIGLNVFIIKAVVGDRIPLETIFRGIAWFLLADAVVVALLLAFPQLSLFLPSLM